MVCHIIIASLIFEDLYLYEGLVDDNFKQICYIPTFSPSVDEKQQTGWHWKCR